MEHTFELPVSYGGHNLLFPGRLVAYTYSYKIFIDVDGITLSIEKDDEGGLRVLQEEGKEVADKKLVAAVLSSLQEIIA